MGRAVVLVVSLLMLTAACGSFQGDEADATDDDALFAFDAVLVDLFGTTDTDAYLAQTERAAAKLVVECMNEAGFEFQIPRADAPAPPDNSEPLDYATRYGFGIISGFLDSIEATDFASVGEEDQANLDYLSSLTAAEIERFFVTLDGVEAAPGQAPTDAGCNGKASDDAYADWFRFNDSLPGFRSMAEERDTHPEWLAARTDWQQCMADEGFDYAEPRAIQSDVTSRMRALVVDQYPGGDLPLVQSGEGLVLDPAVEALLGDMMRFEINAAVADAECTEPLRDRFEAVDREVQQGFVDRNRQTIDELLARGGQ